MSPLSDDPDEYRKCPCSRCKGIQQQSVRTRARHEERDKLEAKVQRLRESRRAAPPPIPMQVDEKGVQPPEPDVDDDEAMGDGFEAPDEGEYHLHL